MAIRPEVTGKRAATAASKVLRSSDSSKSAKSAAGSALSQHKAPPKVTSTYVPAGSMCKPSMHSCNMTEV